MQADSLPLAIGMLYVLYFAQQNDRIYKHSIGSLWKEG